MRSLATLAALYVPATAITALIALAVGSPFSLWFRDTPIILGLLLGMMLILGIAWDGLLICVGCVAALLRSGVRRASTGPTLATLRGYRFFSCGPMYLSKARLNRLLSKNVSLPDESCVTVWSLATSV